MRDNKTKGPLSRPLFRWSLARPGGLMCGWDFYDAAFEHVRSDFEEFGFDIEENSQRLAFRYGVCLHDVEQALNRQESPEQRGRGGAEA
jgi:hypothetical protein